MWEIKKGAGLSKKINSSLDVKFEAEVAGCAMETYNRQIIYGPRDTGH